jgi:hypothetical protein
LERSSLSAEEVSMHLDEIPSLHQFPESKRLLAPLIAELYGAKYVPVDFSDATIETVRGINIVTGLLPPMSEYLLAMEPTARSYLDLLLTSLQLKEQSDLLHSKIEEHKSEIPHLEKRFRKSLKKYQKAFGKLYNIAKNLNEDHIIYLVPNNELYSASLSEIVHRVSYNEDVPQSIGLYFRRLLREQGGIVYNESVQGDHGAYFTSHLTDLNLTPIENLFDFIKRKQYNDASVVKRLYTLHQMRYNMLREITDFVPG